jgi:hypothetical protein
LENIVNPWSKLSMSLERYMILCIEAYKNA